jgi:hypothetical protein
MAIAPIISGVPNSRSAWVTTAFWCGAILLIVAALGTHDLVNNSALIGSSVIVALYGCLAMMPILARRGYYHRETGLVAMCEPPRWRFVFDKPVLVLLLFSPLQPSDYLFKELLSTGDRNVFSTAREVW